MNQSSAILELNATHGTTFRSAGRYAGGEVGAERLLDDEGNAYVLKHQPAGLAPETTEALRAVGYPAPRYLVVAETYCVQEELPGIPLGGWDVPITEPLLALNELQQGRAVDDDRSWPATIVESASRSSWCSRLCGNTRRRAESSSPAVRLPPTDTPTR